MAEQSEVPIRSDVDIVAARQTARDLGQQAGFSRSDLTLIATAISELARNILQYAGRGVVRVQLIHEHPRKGVQIEAVDEGPGIADVALALKDGFSTGDSLGLGLPGVRRLMDDFEIQSAPGRGTRVLARKWVDT